MGLSCTKLFIEEGAKVVAVDLPQAKFNDLQGIAEEDNLLILGQDITESNAPSHIVEATINHFEQLDILINCAGIAVISMVEDLDFNDFDRVHNVNVKAGLALAQAAIPHLKQSQAGRIVNFSSIQNTRVAPGSVAYSTSKAAVASMTKSLALELGEFGITANFIEPGAIVTPMSEDALKAPGVTELWENKSPLKRLGQPEDVACGALFLASEDAGFTTGHGLLIEGGVLLTV